MRWVCEAAEGKAKINSKRLYPFEIIKNILDNSLHFSYIRSENRISMAKAFLADAQWKNMEERNFIFSLYPPLYRKTSVRWKSFLVL